MHHQLKRSLAEMGESSKMVDEKDSIGQGSGSISQTSAHTLSGESNSNLSDLAERNRELRLLNQAGRVLTATLETGQVLERLLQVATELIGAEGSSVWLWDETDSGYLVCRAAFHQTENPQLVNLRLRSGQGVAGWVAQTGESAIVVRTSEDSRFYPAIDERSGFKTLSLLTVPLLIRDTIMGILQVVNKVEGDFNKADLAVAETLAASASIAIDNARLVEALQQQKQDLEAQNEELDAFAHTVAHDLQNPLSLLLGFVEVLQQDKVSELDIDGPQLLQTIVRNVQRMSSIVHELLVLSSVRKMDVSARAVAMGTVVNSALERVTHLVEEHQANVTVPDRWPEALGHAPWIEEVWENYLSNALKYGGNPPVVELGATPLDNGKVRFWVRDNGHGLDEAAQAHLFTPFSKLSQIRVTGQGLGLSIVRRIVEKLGGEVGVESALGQGSVFSFTLPGTNSKAG